MWVYRTTKINKTDEHFVYIVGFFKPDGEFEGIVDFHDEMDALWRVHFLNGGSHFLNGESATPNSE
jgi:hypothetical protein